MNNKIKDTVSSVFFMILGGYVVGAGIKMYHTAAEAPYNVTKLSISPALLPLVLGIGLLVLSIILLVNSLKGEKNIGSEFVSRFKIWGKSTFAALKTSEVQHMIGGLIIMAVLAFVLLGRIPFVIGGTLFMIALMLYLRSSKWWKVIIISIVSMIMIFLLFQVAFKTPLP